MIQEDYVSLEVAKLLKEKGFDESIETLIRPDGKIYHIEDYSVSQNPRKTIRNSEINIYSDDVCCPTHQMAMKWLRNAHNIHINGDWSYKNKPEETGDFSVEYYMDVMSPVKNIEHLTDYYPTYEDAVEAALKYCLTNLI